MFLYLRKTKMDGVDIKKKKAVMSSKTYFLMREIHSLFPDMIDHRGTGILPCRALSGCVCFMPFKGLEHP